MTRPRSSTPSCGPTNAGTRTDKDLTTADLLGNLNTQLEKRYQELRAKRQQRMMFEQRNPKIVESGAEGLGSKTLDLLKEDLAAARINKIEQESYYEGLEQFASEPEKLRQYVYSRNVAATITADEQERIRLQSELLYAQLQLERLSAIGGSAKERNLFQNWQSQLQEKLAQLDKDFVQNQIAAAKAFAENARKREQQVKEAYDKEFSRSPDVGLQYAEYVFIIAECQTIESMCDSPPQADQRPGHQREFRGLEDSRAGEGDGGAGAVLAAAAADPAARTDAGTDGRSGPGVAAGLARPARAVGRRDHGDARRTGARSGALHPQTQTGHTTPPAVRSQLRTNRKHTASFARPCSSASRTKRPGASW